MKTKAVSEKKRKPYQKPQVEQVELRPEEAVLHGCKGPDWTGPKGLDCLFEKVPCSAIGT